MNQTKKKEKRNLINRWKRGPREEGGANEGRKEAKKKNRVWKMKRQHK